MGPPEQTPEFPYYDTFTHPDDNALYPIKLTIPCNWLQIVENACDPIHNAYLHAIVSGEQFSPAFKVLPALDFVETPLGFLSMATRKVKDKVYIRASDIILPNVAQFASGNNNADDECFNISCGLTRWVVPIDDHHLILYRACSLQRTNQCVSPCRSVRTGCRQDGLYRTDRRPSV